MAAAKINLTINKGAQYLKTFIWRDSAKAPISLTGYSARMQIRETIESVDFEVELTTANGKIELEAGAETGRIDLILGATVTDAMTITTGVYDFELYADADEDDVKRLLEGVVSVVSSVTR